MAIHQFRNVYQALITFYKFSFFQFLHLYKSLGTLYTTTTPCYIYAHKLESGHLIHKNDNL